MLFHYRNRLNGHGIQQYGYHRRLCFSQSFTRPSIPSSRHIRTHMQDCLQASAKQRAVQPAVLRLHLHRGVCLMGFQRSSKMVVVACPTRPCPSPTRNTPRGRHPPLVCTLRNSHLSSLVFPGCFPVKYVPKSNERANTTDSVVCSQSERGVGSR